MGWTVWLDVLYQVVLPKESQSRFDIARPVYLFRCDTIIFTAVCTKADISDQLVMNYAEQGMVIGCLYD